MRALTTAFAATPDAALLDEAVRDLETELVVLESDPTTPAWLVEDVRTELDAAWSRLVAVDDAEPEAAEPPPEDGPCFVLPEDPSGDSASEPVISPYSNVNPLNANAPATEQCEAPAPGPGTTPVGVE